MIKILQLDYLESQDRTLYQKAYAAIDISLGYIGMSRHLGVELAEKICAQSTGCRFLFNCRTDHCKIGHKTSELTNIGHYGYIIIFTGPQATSTTVVLDQKVRELSKGCKGEAEQTVDNEKTNLSFGVSIEHGNLHHAGCGRDVYLAFALTHI